MKKRFLNPHSLPDWSNVFSQVVVVEKDQLKFIYIAGQVAVDADNQLVGQGNLEAQLIKTLENLRSALSAAGATLSDVVRTNIYLVQHQQGNNAIIRNVYSQFFGNENLPVSNWIGVQRLASEGFLVEIDAEAVIESNLPED